MADTSPSYIYKETRVNLESTIPGSNVVIRLPTSGAASWSARATHRKTFSTDIPIAEDENAFKQKHLASEASICHRQHHVYPRSFLWRVLEDRKVLSIQAADLCRQEKTSDTTLTLRLSFPHPIRRDCIAFADPEGHDVLNVFVLTESSHLYSLTLRPEFFRKRSSTEDNIVDWCKIYQPSAFSFKHPHRLVARNSEELLVSLHDGGLLRLDRIPGEDSSSWKETFYNEGAWHGIRSLLPFQGNNTVKHGKINLELAAATSIALADIKGVSYAFTISLDHRIRAWNLSNGRISHNSDLLNQERSPQELARFLIDPSQSHLVEVYQDVEEKILIVTYSPNGAGQFKFWQIAETEEGSVELLDVFPDTTFVAPPPTSDVWTMAGFSAVLDSAENGNAALWILWKNNTTYRVQKVEFSVDSASDASRAWENDWTAVASETIADSPLPVIVPSDPADCTDKWLNYILYPGRFSNASLETALSIYERGLRNTKNNPPRSTKNMVDRMCSLVASSTTMARASAGQGDYEHFRSATDAQWRRFYRLVLELDKQRGEALSLAFDSEHEMVWVVSADGLSAIRDCSDLERLWHNPGQDLLGIGESVPALISAASAFRDTFSDSLLYSCTSSLQAELFQDPTFTDSVRLQNFYEKCNFAGQVGDDDYTQLVQNLGGNFKGVTLQVYNTLLDTMTSTEDFDHRLERLPLTAFGRKTVIRGVQETVELHKSICFDQLVLLAFIEGEIDQEEEGMQLDTSVVYKQLLLMLKRLELIEWLSRTLLSISIPRTERSNSISSKDKVPSPTKRPEDLKTVSVLEGTIGHLLGLVTHSGESTASLLKEVLIRLCEPASAYELQTALIQCFLLKTDRPDLAVEFSRFCDQDPFSVYVLGRAFLAAKDLQTAAIYFKKAAFGLAQPELRGSDRHSSGLLDDTEWNLLNAGLPHYYSHIVSLFDKAKYYSFVIDFARLALQFAPSYSKDDSIHELRTDLVSRLFNAALQTSCYDQAYSSLTLFTDIALQHTSVRALVYKMCESAYVSELLDFPFLGLHDTVDDILEQKCHSITDVSNGVPYHKILYSWRIKRNDFRGAAAVAFEHLQRLKLAGEGDKIFGHTPGRDDLETPVTRQYLTLINALSCVDPKQAWILCEPLPAKGMRSDSTPLKRKVITLDDVRKGYQAEMDRIAAIENNQFAFVGTDTMDVV